MDEYTVSINLPAVQNTVQVPLQHIVDMLTLGLMGVEAVQENELKLPDTFYHVLPASNVALSVEEAKTRFKTWILRAAMRNFIEVISVFLEELRYVCSGFSIAKDLSVNGGAVVMTDDMAAKFNGWQATIASEKRRFHRLGLPDKIEGIKRQYDPSIIPSSVTDILSLNAARNCLVHRTGIIAEQDKTCDDGLLVEWQKFEFQVDGQAVDQNAVVESGQTLIGQFAKSSKLFKLGEQISFTTDEVNEICFTCLLFAMQCVENVQSYWSAQGIQFTERKGAG